MPGVLFLVQFNNFARTMGFYWSYTLLLLPLIFMRSCGSHSSVAQHRRLKPRPLTGLNSWQLLALTFLYFTSHHQTCLHHSAIAHFMPCMYVACSWFQLTGEHVGCLEGRVLHCASLGGEEDRQDGRLWTNKIPTKSPSKLSSSYL